MFQKTINTLWPKYIWLIPFVLISPAVFLIPNDVFTQYPWAKTYTDWLAQWIPMIDRASHLHPHPDKFKAFFAYAWSWLPVCLTLAWFERQRQIQAAMTEKFHLNPVVPLLGVLFAVWGLWLLNYAPGEPFGQGEGVASLIRKNDLRSQMYFSDLSLLWSGALQVYGSCLVLLLVAYTLNFVRTEIYAIKTPGQEH